MKPVVALLFALAFAQTVHGLSIDSVVVSPAELWLGDQLNITAVCTDNSTIDRVYTDVNGPGVILPSLDFYDEGNNTYKIPIPGNYFDRKGGYTAVIFCQSNGTKVNATSSFVISELTGEISSYPSYVYSGDTIEVHFLPKKDGGTITSDISFSVSLDGQAKPFKVPPIYDTQKGWLLRIDSPNVPRVYNLGINALYSSKNIYASTTLEVKGAIEFELTGLDKQSATPRDNVTLYVKALYRGAPIQLNTTGFSVRVNSAAAATSSIAQSGSSFNVRAILPDLSPGRYQIAAELYYNGSSYVSALPIDYVTVLSGKLTDSSGKPVNARLRFFKSGVEKLRLNTLSDGTYSGQIIPDTYDVDIDTDDAAIHIDKANVNVYSEPIKYYYDRGGKIDGLVVSGLHTIGVSWAFEKAAVTLKYDESMFSDETKLVVFRCPSLTNGKCSGKWSKISPVLDTNSNTVTFSVSGFSVFAAGIEDAIKLSLNLDKAKYRLRDVVRVRGSTSGHSGQITNVSVLIKIKDTLIEKSLSSDQNGVFSVELVGPETEGMYKVQAYAEKYPHASYETSYDLAVAAEPSVSIVFPGSVQVGRGDNVTEDIVIVNTGQKNLTGVRLAIGLDEKFYGLGAYPDRIPVKEEVRVPVTFFAGVDEALTTHSGLMNFTSAEISQEKIFGFTVVERRDTENAITGFVFSMPDQNTIYITLFASAAFLAAFLSKRFISKRKSEAKYSGSSVGTRGVKGDASSYLYEVKNYLNSKKEARMDGKDN